MESRSWRKLSILILDCVSTDSTSPSITTEQGRKRNAGQSTAPSLIGDFWSLDARWNVYYPQTPRETFAETLCDILWYNSSLNNNNGSFIMQLQYMLINIVSHWFAKVLKNVDEINRWKNKDERYASIISDQSQRMKCIRLFSVRKN